MSKRPMLSSVCALALLALASSSLAAAVSRAPEGASPGTGASFSDSAAGGQRAGWTLTLKGKLTKVLPISKVKANVTWDGTKAGNINPTLRAKYRGQTLYTLIGLVDDKDPSGFNVALAKKGYDIKLYGLDGYTWTISSKTIVGKKKWIVAKLKNGKPLPTGEKPFRYVGSFIKPFNGKASVYKLYKIVLIF
jgi:hypothetical protein